MRLSLRKIQISVSVSILAFLALGAQTSRCEFRQLWNPFPVIINGDTVAIPFLGGFNDPKPSLIDFDHDGLTDLMVGDLSGRLLYFRNSGSAAVPVWTILTERFGGVDIGSWHTFCDIDGDNDFDLFCDSRLGQVAFYRNDSVDSVAQFTLVDLAFGGFPTGTNNTPDFADLDNDGDYDFFFGEPAGGTMTFYENIGTATLPDFSAPPIPFYDSIIAFPGQGGGPLAPENPNHGSSGIRFADIDADNDLDLFWGDILNTSMYQFINWGTVNLSSLKLETEFFLPAPTIGFNHPALADLDNDNDLELLVGVANGSNIDNLILHRNMGTATSANFVVENLNLISTIDLGSFAFPTFGDLDNDGDLDLLIGSEKGTIVHYENSGSAISPRFEWRTDNFGGISVGLNSAPDLADWDNDGDLDLLIGNQKGNVQFWRNDGDKTTFVPVLADGLLANIKVDQLAVPRVVDWDQDGRNDLVVGEWDFNSRANLLLYENIGTATNPSLVLRSSALLKRELREFTSPFIYDWDKDGRKDVILGGRTLGMTFFRNTAPTGTFPDSLKLRVQTDLLPGNDAGSRPAWTAVDIDADGDDDVFVGEENGGLNFFLNEANCCVGMRGNIDSDPADVVDIADLTTLIDHLFINLQPLPCTPEADLSIDGSGTIEIDDLTVLIDHLFISLTDLPSCP